MRHLPLFLVVLAACSDTGGVDAPVLTARFPDPTPPGVVLLDPVNLVVDRDTVVVAQAHGWRLLRFGLTPEPSPALDAGLELASATPGRSGSTWIPTVPSVSVHGQQFGRILSADGRGRFLLSGVDGDLWTFEDGDAVAVRVGAGPGGLTPTDGLAIGAADLSGVTAAALEPRSGRLFVISGDAVYSCPTGLRDGTDLLRRVAGSGAQGTSLPGQAARRSPLRLGLGSLVAADGAGGLVIAEGGTGRVLLVPDVLAPGAVLVHVAGGGFSLDDAAPPRDRNLEFAPGNSLLARRDAGAIEMYFFSRGSPHRLVAQLDSLGAGEIDAVLEPAARVGARAAGGLGRYRDHYFFSRRDEGTVDRVEAGSDVAVVVAGGDGTVPRLGRPGGAVVHSIHGRKATILTDDATGKLLAYLPPGLIVGDDVSPPGHPSVIVNRTSGTNFELFRNLATIPTPDGGALLALGSRFKIQLFQVESGRAATFIGPGAGVLALDRLAMGSYYPAAAPILIGASDDAGLLFFDPSDRVLAVAEAPITSGSRIEALGGHASSPRLPFDRASSLNVVDVRGFVGGSLSAQGAGVLVLRTAGRGDLLLGFRSSNGRGGTLVAGREVPGRSGIVVAGGGAAAARSGLSALEVGFAGVSGAALLLDGEVVMVRGEDVAVVGQDGVLLRVDLAAVPLGTEVAPACGAGLVHLVSQDAVWSYDAATGEQLLAHEGPSAGLVCADGASAVAPPGPPRVYVSGAAVSVEDGEIFVEGEQVSGVTMAALEGRTAADARLADELPVMAGLDNGALVAGVGDCLLSWEPGPTGFTRSTPTRVLYEGAPLTKITAIAADGESLVLASGGRVFRFEPSDGPPGRRGQLTAIAGGGDRLGTAAAFDVRLDDVSGLLPGPDGQLAIRHSAGVSLLRGDSVYVLLDGVGPAGDHPSLAMDPASGELFVPDPRAQQVPRLPAPW